MIQSRQATSERCSAMGPDTPWERVALEHGSRSHRDPRNPRLALGVTTSVGAYVGVVLKRTDEVTAAQRA